jgi:putative flippase GtrA
MQMSLSFKRFIRYATVGGSTFIFDLLLLRTQVEMLEVNYFPAASSSFLIAVSVNYFFSRKWVFKGTQRKHAEGYLFFINTAVVGALATGFLMWLFCVKSHEPYLPVRVAIAAVIGMANYLIHLFLNFRVSGYRL